MRLQKFLSAAGFCSRRKGEEYIKAGRVQVNARVESQLGIKVDPDNDLIKVDGQRVQLVKKFIYVVINKPRGYVTSCSQKNEKLVLEIVDLNTRLFPVGRLDKNSTGLLILTNDGMLHHEISHPSFDHEKEYRVNVKNDIAEKALQKMAGGLTILGSKTRPAIIKKLSKKSFSIVLKEGRNRQIRRMVQKTGNEVTQLERVRIAHIHLGNLKKGAWRFLTKKEIQQLLAKRKKDVII
jgi:pseudouridine synthase